MKRKSAHTRRQRKLDYKYKKGLLDNKTLTPEAISQVIKQLELNGIKTTYENNVFTITKTGETFLASDVLHIIAQSL